MTAHATSHVYFGWNAMWVSTCILAITYATIMSEKVNRAIVALVGAGVMILIGVLGSDSCEVVGCATACWIRITL